MWVVGSLILLLILSIFLIRLPSVQNYLSQKAINYLEDKLQTEVSLKHIYIGFPKSIVIEDFYVEDKQRDTLIDLDYLEVDMDMWSLFSGDILIDRIDLNGFNSNVYTVDNESYNFNFIIESFSSGDTEKEPSQSSKQRKFKINELNLQDIKLDFNDQINGLSVTLQLGTLFSQFKDFDPLANTYKADQINLENSNIRVKQFNGTSTRQPISSGNESSPLISLGAQMINIKNTNIDYLSIPNGQQMAGNIGILKVKPRNFSLSDQFIDISEVLLENSDVHYEISEGGPTDSLTENVENARSKEEESNWEVTLDKFHGQNNSLTYDDHRQPVQKEGIDYAHMQWSQLEYDLQDIHFIYPEIQFSIQQFKAHERSGFTISQLRTIFEMDGESIHLQDFRFESPHSLLRTDSHLEFKDLNQFSDQIGNIQIQSDWVKSTLGIKDLLYFQPGLKNISAFQKSYRTIGINGNINGLIKDLNIPDLSIQYGKYTKMVLNGRIAGLPNIDTTYFDLSFPTIRSTRSEWEQLLPEGTLPEGLQLPDEFKANGSITGTLEDLESSLNIQTSLGDISAKGSLKKVSGATTDYAIQATMTNLQLGKILNDTTTFGTTSLDLDMEGSQLSWPDLRTQVNVKLDHIIINSYRYSNISFNAQLEEQRLEYEGNIQDSNLIASYDGHAFISQEALFRLKGNINISGSDLLQLQLSQKPLRAKGDISFDLKGLDPDSLQANVRIKNGLLITKERQYYVDSVYSYFNTLDSITELSIHSDIIQGELKGNVDPLTFTTVFRDQIAFYLNDKRDTFRLDSVHQQFDFHFQILETPLLTDLILPSLSELKPSSISGSYDSKKHRMQLKADFPRIVYSGFQVDSLQANINSGSSSMTFSVSSQKISNETLLVPNPTFSGEVQGGILDMSLGVSQDTGTQYIYWAGKLSRPDDMYHFQFNEGGFMLDDQNWSIPEDHFIKFGDQKILVHNLNLSNGSRSISVEKLEQKLLAIRFREFQLEELARAFKRDGTLLSGSLGGLIEINPQTSPILYDADLDIEEFTFMGSKLGQLSIQSSSEQDGTYAIQANVTGNSNDAQITGKLQSSEQAFVMDLKAEITRLQLQSLEGFTLGYIEDTEGYLKGSFDIGGQFSDPQILGQMTFHETQMRVTELNTLYRINNESLRFEKNRILFDGFSLLDSLGNPADFSGYVSLQNLSNPAFNLDVKMNEFYLLNKKEEKGAIFYGDMILNSELQVRGDLARPVISASAQMIQGSEMVFVMPTEDPRLETSGGIDEFVDRDQELHAIMEFEDEGDTVRSNITGIDLRATIRTDRNSKLTIYLDEGKGNFIQVQGDADLIFGMDPSGQMTLTGRYQVYDGKYQLLFRNVVKRIFQLQQGSSIVWTGNPLQARVDLTAIHTKYAEPIGLIQGQISEENQALLNRYKQSYPFEVVLNMDEQLTSPSIDFDIRVAEQYRGALGSELEAKLTRLNQNESEVNKQVFALLVLGRFLPEDPFNVSGGGSVEATARRSVSKLLNAQLEKLSDKYIDAFELNLSLDSYEDYTTGEAEGRTELNIGINKAFFNDRLTVSVGGNVELEGSRTQQQKASDLIGDISVEYVLTENGNWKLRAFRKNEYEGVIDGDIIKTGASLIFSKDYNTISDLFKSKNKE